MNPKDPNELTIGSHRSNSGRCISVHENRLLNPPPPPRLRHVTLSPPPPPPPLARKVHQITPPQLRCIGTQQDTRSWCVNCNGCNCLWVS